MKVLAVCPGASWSTRDVYDGLTAALRRRGVEVLPYDLSTRIGRAASWLRYNWRRARKRWPEIEEPTQADVFYQAGVGAIERALRFQPDWVLVFSAMYLHPDVIVMLHRAGQRVAVLFTESPYDDVPQAKLMPAVDVAFTNERISVPRLQAANPRAIVRYLPHAYDPERHTPEAPGDTPEVPAHDVVFVGTAWDERVALFDAVDWEGISADLGRPVDVGFYGNWTRLPSRHRLRRYLRGGTIDNAMTAALYRRAAIGINLHRADAGAESLNPRVYELAATGCFFATDERRELVEVFGPGVVPTFRTPQDLERLIRHYLARPEERQAIAARCRAAVTPHTFDARAETVLAGLAAASRPFRPLVNLARWRWRRALDGWRRRLDQSEGSCIQQHENYIAP